jgi:hypothetical protein
MQSSVSVEKRVASLGLLCAALGRQEREVEGMRRITFVGAVVGSVVTLLAVLALPGVGLGETTTSHGLTPSDVYSTTEPDVCHPDKIGTDAVALLPTVVEVGQKSHLVVYFASMWSGFEVDSVLVRKVEIVGENGFFENSPDFDVSPGQVHSSGTLMWAFENIDPGTYTVEATAALYPEHGAFISHGSGVNLQSCALTVFVSPAA